jgi:3D (Asp-Asp-Asp) domain-containing protein
MRTVCSQGEHVFGPFTTAQHDSCLKSGGGVACETMRWSRSFFEGMGSTSENPRPISPPVSSEFGFNEPKNSEIVQVKSAWATFYRIPTVRDVGDGGVPLLDMTGRRLGPALNAEDWCHASLEGSVRVLTAAGHSAVFNYIGSREERIQVDCSRWISLPGLGYSRFFRARGAFGDGVDGYSLQPYRTIAVDPEWLKYGSVVYIPAARGSSVALPDGRTVVHDGYFFAADTGGALYGNHIDVFVGSASDSPFKFVRSSKSARFDLYIINNRVTSDALSKSHLAKSFEN